MSNGVAMQRRNQNTSLPQRDSASTRLVFIKKLFDLEQLHPHISTETSYVELQAQTCSPSIHKPKRSCFLRKVRKFAAARNRLMKCFFPPSLKRASVLSAEEGMSWRLQHDGFARVLTQKTWHLSQLGAPAPSNGGEGLTVVPSSFLLLLVRHLLLVAMHLFLVANIVITRTDRHQGSVLRSFFHHSPVKLSVPCGKLWKSNWGSCHHLRNVETHNCFQKSEQIPTP